MSITPIPTLHDHESLDIFSFSSAGAGATVSRIKGSNRALALPLDGSDLTTQLDPKTVKLFFEGRIEIRGRRVFILSPISPIPPWSIKS